MSDKMDDLNEARERWFKKYRDYVNKTTKALKIVQQNVGDVHEDEDFKKHVKEASEAIRELMDANSAADTYGAMEKLDKHSSAKSVKVMGMIAYLTQWLTETDSMKDIVGVSDMIAELEKESKDGC